MKTLTLNQVAQRFGVSEQTVRKFKAQLPGGVLVGRRIRYNEDSIAEFIRRGGCRPVGSQSTAIIA